MLKSPDGLTQELNLKQSINVDTILQDIKNIEGDSPHTLNNGIFIDGGITELYEKNKVESTYTGVVFASTGAKVSMDSSGNVFVNDIQIGTTSKYFVDYVKVIPGPYTDAMLSDAGTVLAIRNVSGTPTIDEISPVSLAVLNTKTIAQSVDPSCTLFMIRANSNTFSNTTECIADLEQAGSTSVYEYVVAGSITIISTAGQYPSTTQTQLTAYKNGGRYIVCSYDASIMYHSNTPTVATWTTVVEMQFLAPTQLLATATTTMALVGTSASSSNKSFVSKTVAITAGGVLTTTNQIPFAGWSNQAGNYAGPWGSSGNVQTTGTPTNNAYSYPDVSYATVKYSGVAATNIAIIDSVGQFTDGAKSYRYKTAKGQPGILAVGADSVLANRMSEPGKAICTFGDLNPGFIPDIRTNTGSFVIYRNAARGFNVVSISTTINAQEISAGIVRLENCSSYCIIDTINKVLMKDWSSTISSTWGQMLPTGTSTWEVLGQNQYSTMVDMSTFNGVTTPAVTKGSYTGVVGQDESTGAYVYENGKSTGLFVSGVPNAVVIVPNTTLTLIPSLNLPIPSGSTISQGGVRFPSGAAIQIPNQSGYQLANEIVQNMGFFRLFGVLYGYDNTYIYQIQLSGGITGTIVGVPQIITSIVGLTFLANSQSLAFFLSAYDNSVWTFDGGRTVDKSIVLSQKPAITGGVYNIKNDELLLTTASTLLTIRDRIITENTAPYSSFSSFSTADGVYFADKSGTIQWKIRTYQSLSGSTLIPLVWQSAFIGFGTFQKHQVNRWLFRVLVTASMTVTLSWAWFTEDSTGTDTQSFTIVNFNSLGYATFDWTPTNSNVLGGSIGISTADSTHKILILEVVPMMVQDSFSTISNHA